MIPSTWMLWAVTLLYAAQAMTFLWQRQYAQALILGGYTIANIGLLWTL